MRFRRWHRPEPYRDTSRKRAAFHRKQRLEREALSLFAKQIAVRSLTVRPPFPFTNVAAPDLRAGFSPAWRSP